MFILIAFVFIVLLVYKSTQREHLRQSDLDSITVTITDSQTIPSGYSLKYRCIFTLGDTTQEIISDSNTVTLSESTNRAAFDALKGELTGNNVINDVEQEMTVEIFAQFYQGSTLISTSASSFSKTHTFSASGALIPDPPSNVTISIQTTNGSTHDETETIAGITFEKYKNKGVGQANLNTNVSKASKAEIVEFIKQYPNYLGFMKISNNDYRPITNIPSDFVNVNGKHTFIRI